MLVVPLPAVPRALPSPAPAVHGSPTNAPVGRPSGVVPAVVVAVFVVLPGVVLGCVVALPLPCALPMPFDDEPALLPADRFVSGAGACTHGFALVLAGLADGDVSSAGATPGSVELRRA
jgi:hypothetical protein